MRESVNVTVKDLTLKPVRNSKDDIPGERVRWSRRLPVAIGAGYLVVASPFLFGIFIPSIHEGDVYSALFVLTVLPVVLPAGGLLDWLVQHTSSYFANNVTILLAWCFWVGLSFGLGAVVDKIAMVRQK